MNAKRQGFSLANTRPLTNSKNVVARTNLKFVSTGKDGQSQPRMNSGGWPERIMTFARWRSVPITTASQPPVSGTVVKHNIITSYDEDGDVNSMILVYNFALGESYSSFKRVWK